MEKLDDDCLEIIFGNLNAKDLVAAAKVCRKWKNVAYSRSLWRRVNIELKCGLQPLSMVMVSSLEDRGVCNIMMKTKDELRMLPTDAAQRHKEKQLECVIQSLPLRELSLKDFDIDDQKLQTAFSKEMIHLKVLHLPFFAQYASVLHVSKLCPNLHRLTATSVRIPGHMVAVLTRNMPHLRELDVDAFTSCTDDTMKDICLHLPDQRIVSVYDSDRVSNTGIAELARMKHLHNLTMMHCQGITADFIRILAETNSPVKDLFMCSCLGIDNNQMLINIGKHRLPVQGIKITGSYSIVTDDGIKGLLQNSPNPLIFLQLPALHWVTMETSEALLRKHCPNLLEFRD